jgi:hypothetical protein
MRLRWKFDVEIRGGRMSQDWIEKRFDKWKSNNQEWERRHALDSKAAEASDAWFQKLIDQIKEDLAIYNERFQACVCDFYPQTHGFQLVRRAPSRRLTVTKRPGETIVKLELTGDKDHARRSDVLELKTDYRTGAIYFSHGERRLRDVSEASEVVLDHVICGPNENALPDDPTDFLIGSWDN